MPHPPTPGKRCAVDGCRAWAVRGRLYCAPHLHQYDENVRLATPDPAPRLLGHNPRLCRARGCKHRAVANSEYCASHAEQYRTSSDASDLIATQFTALLAQLKANVPDCVPAVQRELDLLNAARTILVAHAEAASLTGWKAISSMTFMRLWLSSTSTANDLINSKFVMENASGADIDRLLANVYARLEAGPAPAQQPLPGMSQTMPPLPASALSHLSTLSTPEEQLAEWLLEANTTLGTRTLLLTAQAFALENPDDQTAATALASLAHTLPDHRVAEPAPPIALADRLTTLADILRLGPHFDRVAALVAAQRSQHEQP